ncbi:MAG: hypothetical protein WBG14_07050, partial [Rhodococcus sp. (in: high G+C Gram-positive bacteria)]
MAPPACETQLVAHCGGSSPATVTPDGSSPVQLASLVESSEHADNPTTAATHTAQITVHRRLAPNQPIASPITDSTAGQPRRPPEEPYLSDRLWW